MTNILLPYLVPMLLGRTIDLTSYRFGGSIYDYAHYTETPVDTLNTTYYVLQDASLPFSVLSLPVDVVLRIKSDYLTTNTGSMGLSGLLKDTSWKYNSALVAAITMYRTVDRSLMDNATEISDWKQKISWSQTHYADKLMYGAWCAVLFRFKCDVPGDVHTVRNILTENLGSVGQLGDNTVASWNKTLKEIEENTDIRGKVKVSTTVYSTIPVPTFITSPESYIEAIKNFKTLVKSPGQPVFMSLKPIHNISEEYPEVTKNEDQVSKLEKINEMYDDLRVTKENLVRWTTDSSASFSDENEERIYSLLEKMNSGIRAFQKVNEDVSLYKRMDESAIDLAFHQYLIGLVKGMGTYNLAYMRLREEIDADCENKFLHKIKGLLKVYQDEMVKKGEVKGGLEECQKYCLEDERCRAVGFAPHISELDFSTGLHIRKENQCWIYYRSTTTAIIHTPNDMSGDMGVYDRHCYIN